MSRRLNRGMTPDRVVDLLTSLEGEWFTVPQIIAEFEDRWPSETKPASIKAAVRRLYRRGHPDLTFETIEHDRVPYYQLRAKGRMSRDLAPQL